MLGKCVHPALKRCEESKMKEMLWEMFRLTPWWGYVLTGVAGIGFGVWQFQLLYGFITGQKTRKRVFVYKYILWAVAIIGIGAASVALCLFFVLCGTVTLLVATACAYQKIQKKE